MEALANGQNLPTEVNSKLMQLGEFGLKFGVCFCFQICLRH